MSDSLSLAEDTFEKLGTSTDAVRDVRSNLDAIGEEILSDVPHQHFADKISSKPSRVTPRGESNPRGHMWVMFAREADAGFPELIHPEILVGEDDDGPYAAVRFNAEEGRLSDERQRLAEEIAADPEAFLDYLSELDGYTIHYQPRWRDKISKPVEDVTTDEVANIGDQGLTSLLITRRYRPDEGIFEPDFIDSAKNVFYEVFFPMLIDYTFPGADEHEVQWDESVNYVEEPEPTYFILKTGADQYADVPEEEYHFKSGIPGSRQLREATNPKVIYLEDDEFYATGEIETITTEEREDETHYFAQVTNYQDIDPIEFDQVRDYITPEFPIQYGIIKITAADYDFLLGNRDQPPIEPADRKKWTLGEIDRVSPRFDRDPSDIELPDLYFPNEDQLLNEILDALRRGRHLLFVGPPGTGKSKLAKQIADTLMDSHFEMTTATADWSTFDTIGGYRQQRDQTLSFAPGLFLNRFQTEEGRPANEWLIVDEFNRANIDKAFGTLFSVLANDDVVLPFTDDNGRNIVVYGSSQDATTVVHTNEYVVPDDWRLLATMNTFDKSSLYDLSYALSRRFSYIHVPAPSIREIDTDLIKAYVTCWDDVNPSQENIDDVAAVWRAVQQERSLGPAFARDLLATAETDLTAAVTQHVLPQFEGLMNTTQQQLLENIAETGVVDTDRLERFGQQYFELPQLHL